MGDGPKVRTPPRHPPHVTLGAARVGSADGVAALAESLAAGRRGVPVVLDHLGIFPGGSAPLSG